LGTSESKSTSSHEAYLAPSIIMTLAATAPLSSVALEGSSGVKPAEPFSDHGYYLLPCRTPTLSYAVYRPLPRELR
jgi:hypothetical protein